MFQGSTKVADTNSYDVETALAGARAEAGLSDFGDDVFMEPLTRLITGALDELAFTPVGLISFKATIQRFLVNRLRLQRDITAHPEILDEDVSDPIVILGMPRTGTTKLQRMISADPRMQKLDLWKVLNPAPFDDETPGNPEGRISFAKIVEEATRANSAFTTSHETAAEEADEDSFLALMSFDYVLLAAIFPSKSYLEWVQARPQIEAHRLQKRMLQYLQWQDGGRRDRRWVLKNPAAIGFLKQVNETFPNATFVHSHRDMVEVIPSYCRLIEGILGPLLEPTDLKEYGRSVIDYWRPEVARYHSALAELGDRIHIMDVPYTDIVKNPMAVTKAIYDAAHIPFTPEAEVAINVWLDANQQHKHGKAEYSLERYGLTEAMIADAFPNASNR